MKPLEKIKEFFGKFSKKTLVIAGVGMLAAIAAAVIIASVLNHKAYQTLFTGLNETEAQEILGKLQETGVPYQYKSGQIMVDSSLVDQTKAALVSEGYPKSGFTYDVFSENTSLMSTDFEKQTFKIYQLETRIAATIRCFEGVSDAKVTIAVGEAQRYVLTDAEVAKTSASVMVTMKDNQSPKPEMVKGIQKLVALSIPNVPIENVAVIDGLGNDVTQNQDENDAFGVSEKRATLEQQYESTVENKILNMLTSFYGVENVRVSAKAKVNMEQVVRERINYTAPNEAANSGYVSSQQLQAEADNQDGTAGGVPGADTNADITDYATNPGDENSAYYSRSSDTDYLLNQVKEQGQDYGGTLTDMTISVAINADNLGSLTVDQIRGMVGNVAGIAPDQQVEKINIVNAPFYTAVVDAGPGGVIDPPSPGFDLKDYLPLLIAAAASLLLMIILLTVLLRKRRKKKRVKAEALLQQLELENRHLAEDERKMTYDLAADMESIGDTKIEGLIKTIREFSTNNPEIAAQLLKTWLRGGEGNA